STTSPPKARRRSASGVSMATTRPAHMTATTSQSAASATYWVETSSVRAASRSDRKCVQNRARSTGSTRAVRSSRTVTSGQALRRAEQADLAGRRLDDAQQRAHQRRLAAATGPDQPDDRPWRHLQLHAVQHGLAAELPHELVAGDDVHREGGSRRRRSSNPAL